LEFNQNNFLSINDLMFHYQNEYDEGIELYFADFAENDIGFYTDMPECFLDIDMSWNYPSHITNCIIDYGSYLTVEVLKNITLSLQNLRCFYLQFRFFEKISKDTLYSILENFKSSILRGIDIIVPENDWTDIDSLNSLAKKFRRVLSISIHHSSQNKHIITSFLAITYTTDKIQASNHCGVIRAETFTPNLPTFSEAQQHNTCLNRKISIDTEGNIKNCPSMAQSFGNIRDTSFTEALAHPDLKKYWNIKKDDIAVCKDCEFRYVCTDCRAYIENLDDVYSKPLKCGYNPYTATWEKWSSNPLKQKSIEYYGMQELVK
jgi:SPASM domain peptide maturase of grasp-with-spasm system